MQPDVYTKRTASKHYKWELKDLQGQQTQHDKQEEQKLQL